MVDSADGTVEVEAPVCRSTGASTFRGGLSMPQAQEQAQL